MKCPAHAVGYIEACQSDFNFEASLPKSLRLTALVDSDIEISAHVSKAAIEVLQGLLDIRPWERFSSDRFTDMKRLRFFRLFEWEALSKRDVNLVKPPITPDPDIANCDCFEENILESMGIYDEDEGKLLSAEEQQNFRAFKYTHPKHFRCTIHAATSTAGRAPPIPDSANAFEAPSIAGNDAMLGKGRRPSKTMHCELGDVAGDSPTSVHCCGAFA
jgi:hypothetical protein